MAKSKYLDYQDPFITIFNDNAKMLVVFVSDRGESKAISYDDNFFYVESLIDTYIELVEASLRGWRDRELNDRDKAEIHQLTSKYIKHLKKCCDDLDLSLVRDDNRRYL